VPLQSCSKLRKKINTKLYLMRIMLALKNYTYTPAVLDSDCNILNIYHISLFYYTLWTVMLF